MNKTTKVCLKAVMATFMGAAVVAGGWFGYKAIQDKRARDHLRALTESTWAITSEMQRVFPILASPSWPKEPVLDKVPPLTNLPQPTNGK